MPDVFAYYPPTNGNAPPPSAGPSASPSHPINQLTSSLAGGSAAASMFWALALFATAVTLLHMKQD